MEPLRGGAMSRPIFNAYRRAWAWVDAALITPGCAALNPRLLFMELLQADQHCKYFTFTTHLKI